MKLQELLNLKRNDIKTVGNKTVGYAIKDNKRIKFSVDKARYNEAIKAKNKITEQKNEIIRLNNKMTNIMKANKKMNSMLSKTQSIHDEVFNETPSKLKMISVLHNKAFKHAQQTFMIKPTDDNTYNYFKFLDDIKLSSRVLLSKELANKKGLRIQFTLLCKFYLSTDEDKKLVEKNFNSSSQSIVSKHALDVAIDEFVEDIKYEIESFVNMKSGWVFHSVINLQINSYKFSPIRGSSFIPLPKIIQNKKACLNIHNEDERCFLYCVAAFDHTFKNNAERPTKYLEYLDNYDNTGIEYPMKLNQIPKFEKLNNKTINVYAYEITFDNETKQQSLSIHPIHISKNVITNYKDCINLLLVKENEKSHYVLIKNISALVYAHNNRNKSYICPSCMIPYRHEETLIKHLNESGCTKFGEKVELPNDVQAKEYIQFKNVQKMLKKPFVIYADFESSLLNLERDETLATQKYQKHQACGYAFKRVSTLQKYDKPLQLYRGNGTQDVAEHFIKSIITEAEEIRNIMSKIEPMNLKHVFYVMLIIMILISK